jgi:hypothetical protein
MMVMICNPFIEVISLIQTKSSNASPQPPNRAGPNQCYVLPTPYMQVLPCLLVLRSVYSDDAKLMMMVVVDEGVYKGIMVRVERSKVVEDGR